MANKAKIITEPATFIEVTKDGKSVYYSETVWPQVRSQFDASEFTRKQGIAVYDTRVSSIYAVALFADRDAANEFAFAPDEKLPDPETESVVRHGEQSSADAAEIEAGGTQDAKDNPDAKKNADEALRDNSSNNKAKKSK